MTIVRASEHGQLMPSVLGTGQGAKASGLRRLGHISLTDAELAVVELLRSRSRRAPSGSATVGLNTHWETSHSARCLKHAQKLH